MLAATKHFGRDKYLSHKTRVCRDKLTFVATKVLSLQAYFCRASDTDPVCPMSEQELKSVVLKSKPSTCSADLIPTSLLFDCCDQPILSQIVNDNLLSGSFPSVFQHTILKQLVEKAILDCNNLKNYGPV